MSILSEPTTGTILISDPFLKDFYFSRTLVLLAEHNNDGTFGLILNKPTNLKLSDTLNNGNFNIPTDFDTNIFLGGPVKTDSLFFIHTRNDLIKNSTKIQDGIYWGGDIGIVNNLIETKRLNKNEIRFYIGYAGWEPKQLETEIKSHSWVITRQSADFLLKNPPESLWKKAVLNLGKDYAEWITFPIDPSLN